MTVSSWGRLSAMLGMVCALTFVPARLIAQVLVHVRDQTGRPIGDATVELWNAEELLRVGVTTRGGDVRFDRVTLDSVRFVVTKAVGYAPIRVAMGPDWETGITVTLATRVLTLAPMIVTAGDPCDFPDQREARARWQAMTSDYSPIDAASSLATVSEFRLVSRQGGSPVLESNDPPSGWGVQGSAAPMWRTMIEDLRRNGFARLGATAEGLGGGDWRPAIPVDDAFAGIFASQVFGDQHRFAFIGDDSSMIKFCPRKLGRSGLQGYLHLESNGVLRDVVWRVHAPGLDEPTGGFVLFAPPIGRQRLLLPLTSSVWRERFPGRVSEVIRRYRRWDVTTPDSLTVLLGVRGEEIKHFGEDGMPDSTRVQ